MRLCVLGRLHLHQDPNAARRFLALLRQRVQGAPAQIRYGDDDLLNIIFYGKLWNVAGRAANGHPMNALLLLLRIVVHKQDRTAERRVAAAHVQQICSRVSCADDHQTRPRLHFSPCRAIFQPGSVCNDPPKQAGTADENDCDRRLHDKHSARNTPGERHIHCDQNKTCRTAQPAEPNHLAAAGIIPEDLVNAADPKGGKIYSHDIKQARKRVGSIERLIGSGFKAHQERKAKRGAEQYRIRYRKKKLANPF